MLAYDKLSVIAATVILCALLYLFFNRTTLGTAMRASSENMLAAYYMGIPVKRVVSIVWAISAAVATAAGVLLAPITFIHSNVGLVLGLKAFPAAVLGGFGSIPGAVVGGVLIGVIESMAGFYLPQGWKDVAPYIVLLVVLLLKPEGLFGFIRGRRSRCGSSSRPTTKTTSACFRTAATSFPTASCWRCWRSRRSCSPATWSASWCSSASTPPSASGLMILTGFTGQASLGHAAFLAIGAYTAAYLQQYNVPFPVYFLAAGLLTGVVGALVGFPALRLQGIYLVIATISFAFIVEEILARWESVTHGNEGMRVKTLSLLGRRCRATARPSISSVLAY